MSKKREELLEQIWAAQDTAYDLMSDKKWVDVKTYSDPDGIYEGEIGKIEGVRFVETTEAKIFHAPDLVIADLEELTR